MLPQLRQPAALALVVYLAVLFAVTQLPIPVGPVACSGTQLDPLQIVRAVRAGSGGSLRTLLGDAVVRQFLENVLLFVPEGVLVAALVRRSAVLVPVTGFALSLLVETTQLTGLWGVAPCAYRVFDVSDLMANTTGALLGGLLVAVPAALGAAIHPARIATHRAL